MGTWKRDKSKSFFFLYLHFTWFYGPWLIKEIFEDIMASFLMSCQTFHWYFTPKMVHFQPLKKKINKYCPPTVIVLYIVSRWYFDHFLGPWHIKETIFASMNQYFIGKLSLFLTKVSFDNSEGNQLSYFQNCNGI